MPAGQMLLTSLGFGVTGARGAESTGDGITAAVGDQVRSLAGICAAVLFCGGLVYGIGQWCVERGRGAGTEGDVRGEGEAGEEREEEQEGERI